MYNFPHLTVELFKDYSVIEIKPGRKKIKCSSVPYEAEILI
jgi:hypothetical protein